MKSMTIENILYILEGKIIQGNSKQEFDHISVPDKRVLKDKSLFFHLRKFDLQKYHFNSSHIIVTNQPKSFLDMVDSSVTIIEVSNVTNSYWKFINYYRSQFSIPVIGITGTCGKTTTTEMVKTILEKDKHVNSTILGLNGISMNIKYLNNLDENTEVGVYELGVSHPGNITVSCRYLKPTIGVITNIETYHTLGCKTLDNYIKAKAEIVQGIGDTGTLILNKDNENIKKIDLSTFKGNVYYFGIKEAADFKANNIRFGENVVYFDLIYKNEVIPCSVIGHGEYNVYNALAAIASVSMVGIDVKTACARLSDFEQLPMHVEIQKGFNNCIVIDDTWNNSPLSMNTALDTFEKYKDTKRISILGPMNQLGDYSKEEHHKVGIRVAEMGIDYLITTGDEAKEIAAAAIKMGMKKNNVHICSSGNEIWNILHPLLDSNTSVLLKYSYHYHWSQNEEFKNFIKKIRVEK
jgi:UDP-N-acetylmuramoyl-tripeptide--D-alanyl-D-alanine ligase